MRHVKCARKSHANKNDAFLSFSCELIKRETLEFESGGGHDKKCNSYLSEIWQSTQLKFERIKNFVEQFEEVWK